MKKIKIVRKGDNWTPIVNGKQLKALSAAEVCAALEAYVIPVDRQTVDAPEEFWEEVDANPLYGGAD